MFPLKEVGDYFNNNFIVLKYVLDLDDSEGIAERFSIKFYPSFVFVNSDGIEFSRAIGGDRDPKIFLENIQNATKLENSLAFRKENLKLDSLSILEHIKYLSSIYMLDDANDHLNKFFPTRSVEDNFSKESIGLYNSLIKDINAPIIVYMIDHQKEVAQVMGEKEYRSFLAKKTTAYLSNMLLRLDFEKTKSIEELEKDIHKINANYWLQTTYSLFLAENFNDIKDRNLEAIFERTKCALPGLSTSERNEVFSVYAVASRILKVDGDQDKQNRWMIILCETAIEYEKNPRALENLKRTLDRLKNPQ